MGYGPGCRSRSGSSGLGPGAWVGLQSDGLASPERFGICFFLTLGPWLSLPAVAHRLRVWPWPIAGHVTCHEPRVTSVFGPVLARINSPRPRPPRALGSQQRAKPAKPWAKPLAANAHPGMRRHCHRRRSSSFAFFRVRPTVHGWITWPMAHVRRPCLLGADTHTAPARAADGAGSGGSPSASSYPAGVSATVPGNFWDVGDKLLSDMLIRVLKAFPAEAQEVWQSYILASPTISAGTVCSGTDAPIIAIGAVCGAFRPPGKQSKSQHAAACCAAACCFFCCCRMGRKEEGK